jgi:ribose transport system permease protein
MKGVGGVLGLLERYGLVVLFAVVFLFFALDPSTPQFATGDNMKAVLANESIVGIIALATVFPLVAGQFDLSIGPQAGLASLITAGLMSRTGVPLVPSIVGGVLVGIGFGVINGVLVTRVGINSIVTTLGMTSIIAAIVTAYTSGESIVSGISPTLTDLGTVQWLGVPAPVFFLAGVAILSWYLLEHTPWGRSLQATGSNPRAAEIVGLPVPRMVFSSFVVAGALGGVAGVLLLGVSGSASPSAGPGYLLPALAAALLGGTTIQPGRYNVLGTLVAVYFLAATVSGLTFLGAATWVSDAFNGVALIVAVGISVLSGKRRRALAGAVQLDDEPPQPPGADDGDVVAAPHEDVTLRASRV